MDIVHEVRQFNRFYTGLIGLLDEHLPDSGLSLPEGRVLYELATGGKQTAADLTRTLGIDKAQLSRVLVVLIQRKLVKSAVDSEHAKRRILSLTSRGRAAFAQLDHGTRLRMESVFMPLEDAKRTRLVASMRDIQSAFEARPSAVAPPLRTVCVPSFRFHAARVQIQSGSTVRDGLCSAIPVARG